jgi:RNA polymerase sigma factor (sigma-70 family)
MTNPSFPGQLGPLLDPTILVARARSGDQAATLELLRRYRPLLARNIRHSLAYQLSQDRAVDMEDMWQEAVCTFLILLHGYDPARGVPFGGYARALLSWHFLNLRRQVAHKSPPSLDAEELTAVIDPADYTGTVVLRDVLHHLSPRQYQVLEALYLHGQSISETAKDIGITRQAVHATHRRALGKLQQLLAAERAGCPVQRCDKA